MQTNDPDDEVDVWIDFLDDAMIAGDFEKCDRALKETDPATQSLSASVAMLGITICAKNRLPSRRGFYNRTWKEVKAKKGRCYAYQLLRKYR